MKLFPHDAICPEHQHDECRTEQLVPRFSRCLKKEVRCMYAVLTGSYYYCMHPNHLDFNVAAVPGRAPYE